MSLIGRMAPWMAGVILVPMLTGCGRDKERVYEVPKEQSSAPAVMSQGGMPAGHMNMGAPARPGLKWETPAGWTEAPPGSVRVASFAVQDSDNKQADVSVIPLAGDGGGDLANVNRWRGQVGKPPLSADELKASAETVEIAGTSAELYDISGENPSSGDATRILAAIQHREGTAWFYKMTGDDRLVAQNKPAFIGLLKSMEFVAASSAAVPHNHPPLDGGALPEGHPEIGGGLPAGHPEIGGAGMANVAAPSADARPQWQVPSDWKEVPGGQFLVAKFTIDRSGSQAAVNVSASAGDGGGLVSNVNRWRAQLGLTALSDAEIQRQATPVETGNGTAMFVDLSGTDARTGRASRVIGAMIPRGGQTWFYKLMGDTPVVEAEKEAFTQFVRNTKY